MPLLKDKVAVITGASSGIGRAMALMFAAEGAAVVLTARREALLQEVAAAVKQNGGHAEIVVGNVALPETHQRTIDTDTAAAGDQSAKVWAAGLHAMKRIAQPEEIASAALFLASPMANFVTGSALFADGGNAAVK